MSLEDVIRDQTTVIQVSEKEIAGYAIYRSPTQTKLVNIVAINHSFEPLFVKYADLTIDEAAVMMDMLELEQSLK